MFGREFDPPQLHIFLFILNGMKYWYRIFPVLLLLISCWSEARCGVEIGHTSSWEISTFRSQNVLAIAAETGGKSDDVILHTLRSPKSDIQVALEGITGFDEDDDSDRKSNPKIQKSLRFRHPLIDHTVLYLAPFSHALKNDRASARVIYILVRSFKI